MSHDPFDLERFVAAQDAHGTYARALGELRSGAKRSHWMWFVFPQIAGLGSSPMAQRYAIRSLDEAAAYLAQGLGSSPMAQRYAIRSLDEAAAYLAHPVLGARLRECVAALSSLPTSDAEAVLGGIDALKLRSSLTLFLRAAPDERAFELALTKFFGGAPDQRTFELLGAV